MISHYPIFFHIRKADRILRSAFFWLPLFRAKDVAWRQVWHCLRQVDQRPHVLTRHCLAGSTSLCRAFAHASYLRGLWLKSNKRSHKMQLKILNEASAYIPILSFNEIVRRAHDEILAMLGWNLRLKPQMKSNPSFNPTKSDFITKWFHPRSGFIPSKTDLIEKRRLLS